MDVAAPERVAAGREARAPAALLAVLAGSWLVGWLAAGAWWNRDAGWGMVPFVALVLVESAVAVVVGWLVVRRHPRHPVGWLLLAHGSFVVVVLSGPDHPGTSRLAALATQLGQGSWVLLYVSLALIGFLFPTGRFVSRRWRRFAIGCLVGYAAFMAAAGFDASSFVQAYPGVVPPLHELPQWLVGTVGFAGLAAVAASLVGAVASSWVRLRRSDGEERLQMLWFAWAALSIPGGLALCWVDYWLTGGAGVITFLGVTVTGSVLPLAIGTAILRTRLFDIELVLSRTLLYGAMTVLVVGLYAAVVSVVRAVLGGDGVAGLVAVGVVAVAIQPAHARLRRAVERWVYGDRSEPYAALRRLAGRLEQTESAAEIIDTVVACVAEALRVPDVRVELRGEGVPVDDLGAPAGTVQRAPLVHRGELLGDLVLTVPPGRAFSAADRQVLDDLARQAAVAVDAVRLTLDLQRSRARLVTTREEERRRLRRDLHDGLGPSLAAMVLKLNAVSTSVEEPAAREQLRKLRAEVRAAIDEIRRLVDDLRPPALDEVGLVRALRQRAAALSTVDGQVAGTRFDVEGPEDAVPLPAAVEVAAYRIAVEAMTNVVRHSGATRCVVTVEVDAGAVEVAVADNGDRPWRPGGTGVGWTSMRERAAELGGSCTVARRPEGGTAVRAVIPLPAGTLSAQLPARAVRP